MRRELGKQPTIIGENEGAREKGLTHYTYRTHIYVWLLREPLWLLKQNIYTQTRPHGPPEDDVRGIPSKDAPLLCSSPF
jgi:hypothetical protein